MREIDAADAQEKLESLLDLVEQSDELILTRLGRPVARLVPVTGATDRDKARTVVADIIAASDGVTLGGIKIKSLIDHGRR